MNIMYSKTKKFITQLCHVTHWEWRNMAKYPSIS